MSHDILTSICAFDVKTDGTAVAVTDTWPAPAGGSGIAYRWLHFDLGEPALEKWANQFLPPAASSALRQTETRPRCDRLGEGMILNLRGVNMNPGASPEDMVSLRMWITDGLIVSARSRKVFAVDAIRQDIEAGRAPGTIDRFLATLSFGLTKRIERISIELEEETDHIEEKVFENRKVSGLELAQLRGSVIKFRRFIRPQKEALVELAEIEDWLVEASTAHLLWETANRTIRTIESLDATNERLTAIQDHLDILHATALGRNNYVLSVVAAIFLPLGYLTGLFGINVGGMPGVESQYGFLVITGVSIVLGIVLFAVFRFAKWL